jgi:hypothetical protein
MSIVSRPKHTKENSPVPVAPGCRRNEVFGGCKNKNEQSTILLLLLLSDLPQIFPLSSSSAIPHDPIFIDSIAIHFRIFCHDTNFEFISSLHCDESIQ